MTNRDLITACEAQDCADCDYEKECDYFCSIYHILPFDIINDLRKIEEELQKFPFPIKLDGEWLESEVMKIEKS
ncbi:hypothetical protein IKG45_02280 [Candidatus Saccharibacteria bacterium]|nr:hypothetical protein [Candidatus Saccharibacteria bacterium]